MTNEHYYDRATTLTIYTKKRIQTRTGNYRFIWVAKVGDKEVKAYTYKGCRARVAEALELGNLSWVIA
jgi:hypothetical protein